MNLRIAGMGWVTPLGRDIDPVWDRLIRGEEATAQPISDPITDKTYCAFRIPTEALKDLPPHPRLRRASAISRFAAAAGLDALGRQDRQSAGSTWSEWRSCLPFPTAASSTQNVFITAWSSPARNRRVLCFSRKRFSTRPPVI